MHYHHHPSHWLGVVLVAALLLVALEAAGQPPNHEMAPNAQNMFQGRPMVAGAQAGLGAQAGPPQGGIGLQGSEGAAINLRRPRIIEEQMPPLPAVACADLPPTASPTQQPLCLPQVRDERFDRHLARLGIDAQQRGRM